MKKSNLLFTGASWSENDIDRIWDAAKELATEKYGLTFYEPRFEVISYEQMLDNYSTGGMPNMYDHWSFGRQRLVDEKQYKAGKKGLAYEMVLNTNPSICYLMEDNTTLMQCLVILHAAIGHSSFFKNNKYFKEHTDADTIVEDLAEYKAKMLEYEEEHGVFNVESALSLAIKLEYWGVNKTKKRQPLSAQTKLDRKRQLIENYNASSDDLADLVLSNTLANKNKMERGIAALNTTIDLPDENLLMFIADNAHALKDYQRDILRIASKVAQYFYPQRLTKLMNEGWASFWHYTLMHDFYDMGYVSEGNMLEFYASHSGVVYQPTYDSAYFSGINVYALGFDMMQKLRTVCESKDEETKKQYSLYANTDWKKTLQDVAYNFKDETFVHQCLHHETAKKFSLFATKIDMDNSKCIITGIQTVDDFENLRKLLAKQYNFSYTIPDIEITEVDRSTAGIDHVVLTVYIEDDDVDVDQSEIFNLRGILSSLLDADITIDIKHRNSNEENEE